MENDSRGIVEFMKTIGVKPGSQLEITVFEGAEYYNGYTEAPTINPKGYEVSQNMTNKAGRQFMGYTTKFDKGKVSVAFGWDPQKKMPLESELYFHGNIIHSFKAKPEIISISGTYIYKFLASNGKELAALLENDYEGLRFNQIAIHFKRDDERRIFQDLFDYCNNGTAETFKGRDSVRHIVLLKEVIGAFLAVEG